MNKSGFYLFLLFTISWFLHLTARIPALGIIRFDLLLLALTCLSMLVARSGKTPADGGNQRTGVWLKVLIVYAILTIPFVEWPGSVLQKGLQNFAKAVVFYYFATRLIDSEKKLKVFLGVFISCQLFRVLEPVYLHVTEGYWGSFASMANWEYMDRLSGAPMDVVNPNGLAFIILTIVPFAYSLSFLSWRWAVPLLCSLPLCLYALVLTGSRSGLVGLLVVMVAIIMKSKRRVVLLGAFLVLLFVGFAALPSVSKDRYLSIVDSSTANGATAVGRTAGVETAFRVALRRPLFGHGLGTSLEANANFAGDAKPAHDVYAEAAQELGFVGLAIFLCYIVAVSKNFGSAKKALTERHIDGGFLFHTVKGMQIWLIMNVLFSFASYGLSSYEWYLFGGLSATILKLVKVDNAVSSDTGGGS